MGEWYIPSVQLQSGFLNPRNVTKTAQSFYGPCLQSVVHSLTCCFSGNVPLLRTSRYVIPRDSVYQAFPRVSTASDKCWGEKARVWGSSHKCMCLLTRVYGFDLKMYVRISLLPSQLMVIAKLSRTFWLWH